MKKFENFIQGLYDMCHLKYELLPNTVPYFYIMEENELDYKTYLICENNLIFETRSVYRKNDFENIFKLVSNMEISSFNVLKKDDLNSLCDIKKYGKWKKDKSLAIIKDDFTDFEKFVNFIKMIVDKFNKDELTYAFNTLKIGKSMYMPFSNKVGLMLVNFNKYNEDVIAHEMIHFIQDVTGQGIANVKVDSNNTGKFVQIEKLYKTHEIIAFRITTHADYLEWDFHFVKLGKNKSWYEKMGNLTEIERHHFDWVFSVWHRRYNGQIYFLARERA